MNDTEYLDEILKAEEAAKTLEAQCLMIVRMGVDRDGEEQARRMLEDAAVQLVAIQPFLNALKDTTVESLDAAIQNPPDPSVDYVITKRFALVIWRLEELLVALTTALMADLTVIEAAKKFDAQYPQQPNLAAKHGEA